MLGSSSLIVLCDSPARDRFAELFRPGDAGRADQTHQTDVRAISGSGALDLCVLVNDMFFPVSDAASVAGQWLAAVETAVSRVVPPRTVKCWSSVGSSSIIVLCDSPAGLPSSSGRPTPLHRLLRVHQRHLLLLPPAAAMRNAG